MKMIKDKRLAYKNIDGRFYIVSPWDHKLHKLNETGTLIWTCIEKKIPRHKIVQKLIAEFDVSPAVAVKDVDAFLHKMITKGLVG